MRKWMAFGAAVLLAWGVALAAAADAPMAPAEHHAAVWKSRELLFSYQGFTSRYTCDGLRDKVRQVLLDLGARDDLTVLATGCTGLDRPEAFPAVRIELSVLQPVQGAAPAGAVDAQWTPVTLTGYDRLEAGDCELLQQIRDNILPLFAVRAVNVKADCVPHQLPTGVLFRLEVLKAVAGGAAGGR